MKYVLAVMNPRTKRKWNEEYEESDIERLAYIHNFEPYTNAKEWGKQLIAWFNATRKDPKAESPRRLLKAWEEK